MRHFSDEIEGLRLLMADELDAIAGGEGEDTDEAAKSPPEQTLPPIEVIADPIDEWTLVSPIVSGGNFGVPEPNLDPNQQNPAHDEADLDRQACEAARLIRGASDYRTVEHGYFILDDGNGGLRLSQEFTNGSPGEIDLSNLGSRLGISDWSQVRGFVHNHPEAPDYSFVPGNLNRDNRQPSDADWNIADQIATRSGSTGWEFRNYVIGPDGVTRQYDVNDQRGITIDDKSGGNCP